MGEGEMKLKDKDLELLIRELERKIDETRNAIRTSFADLKAQLRKNDWWTSTVTCEDLIENLTEMRMLEEILEKIKDKVEE